MFNKPCALSTDSPSVLALFNEFSNFAKLLSYQARKYPPSPMLYTDVSNTAGTEDRPSNRWLLVLATQILRLYERSPWRWTSTSDESLRHLLASAHIVRCHWQILATNRWTSRLCASYSTEGSAPPWVPGQCEIPPNEETRTPQKTWLSYWTLKDESPSAYPKQDCIDTIKMWPKTMPTPPVNNLWRIESLEQENHSETILQAWRRSDYTPPLMSIAQRISPECDGEESTLDLRTSSLVYLPTP